MSSTSIREDWVLTPHGRLFVKRWKPQNNTGPSNAPIVLFHDSLGCVALWREFPEQLALATGRQVIAYDRLGFGQSDPYPGALEDSFIGDEAKGAFSALYQQLKLEHFIAFGHSVGGAMGVMCAATFPEQCRALVTESAQAFVEDRTLTGIRDAQQAFARDGQLDRLKRYHGDKAAWVLNAWVENWLSDGFRHWNLDEHLPLVRCPVLVIHGDKDEFGSLRQPERFASLPAGPTRVEILPDCGHVPHREQQDNVLEAVGAFFSVIEA